MSATTERTWEPRIVGHEDVDPATLVGNPRNWRLHNAHQSRALAGVLDRVGWVQTVIVNRSSGHLVDGHLRVALALDRGEPTVPVSYVELDEAEERIVLATLDPLGELAGSDDGSLKSLLSTFDEQDAGVVGLLEKLRKLDEFPTQEEIDNRSEELEHRFDGEHQQLLQVICPSCGAEFGVEQEKVANP